MSDQYQMERLDHQNEFILTIKNKHNPKDKLSLKKRNRLKNSTTSLCPETDS